MLKKILLLSAALLFATAGTAAAQDPYPPAGGDDVAVSDSTPVPGQSITITACCFMPGSTVTFTLFSAPVVLGTATANAEGVASLTTTIPEGTTPGSHRIEATGTGADGAPLTVVQNITVVAPGAAQPLPTTGSNSTTPMAQIALAAIAGGGLLVLLANKRRSTGRVDERETAGV